MNLHLFSTPGRDDIRYIVEAARPFLEGKDDPLVAYLPAASLSNEWQRSTENAFSDMARIETIDTEIMELWKMEALLRHANLLYIPGGNTFLLTHRLYLCKIIDFLRKKIAAGMPLVAFSAGTVLCGPNILTSNDLNMVGSGNFTGLNLLPFNFSVHYPDDRISRAMRDDWLVDYHVFHENPVVILRDGAYVKVEGKKVVLVRGDAWILRKGEEKQPLEEDKFIPT